MRSLSLSALVLSAVVLSVLIISLPVCFAASILLQYDQNGNLITGDGLFREYNGLNQLVRIRNGSTDSAPVLESFVYDPQQERVAVKTIFDSEGSVKETNYYFSEDFVRVINASGSFDFEYVFLNNQQVAQVNPDGNKLFVHSDQIGSTTAVTNEAGLLVENTSYTPFGEIITGGQKTRYGYEAQEHDTLIRSIDFHARHYKAEWGIFEQPDSVIPNVYDPQTLNRYSFNKNNPYKHRDPTGHVSWLAWGGVATLFAIEAGFVIGFAESIITQLESVSPERPIDPALAIRAGIHKSVSYGAGAVFFVAYAYADFRTVLSTGRSLPPFSFDEAIDLADKVDSIWGKDDKISSRAKLPQIVLCEQLYTFDPSGGGTMHERNPLFIQDSKGRLINWEYGSIGGVPLIDESVPSGTDVGGGWRVGERTAGEKGK